MAAALSIQGLLEPIDDASSVELPPRFAEALNRVRSGIARWEKAGIPNNTLLAALMTELMPRLVQAYGPGGVASILNQLALELSSADSTGSGEYPINSD